MAGATPARHESPYRRALLDNATRFQGSATRRTAAGSDEDDDSMPSKRRRSPPRQRPVSASKRADRTAAVGTFGTTPRDATTGGLDQYAVHTAPGASPSDAPPVGSYHPRHPTDAPKPVTIPTAPRFRPTSARTPRDTSPDRDTSPSPQAYTPRVPRPHSAHASIGKSKRDAQFISAHGMPVHVLTSTEQPTPSATSYTVKEAATRPTSARITIGKAPRAGGEAKPSSGVLGPGEYNPTTPRKTSPRPVIGRASGNVHATTRGSSNFLLLASEATHARSFATPGAGAYEPYKGSSVANQPGAATFPKAPRVTSTASAAAVARAADNQAAEAKGRSQSPRNDADDNRTIGGLALRRKRGFTFGRAPKDQVMTVAGSKAFFNSRHAAAAAPVPGVGAYGGAQSANTIAEAAAQRERQRQLRRESPPSQRSYSPPFRLNIPGPGAYDVPTSTLRSGRTFNKWLRGSVAHRQATQLNSARSRPQSAR